MMLSILEQRKLRHRDAQRRYRAKKRREMLEGLRAVDNGQQAVVATSSSQSNQEGLQTAQSFLSHEESS